MGCLKRSRGPRHDAQQLQQGGVCSLRGSLGQARQDTSAQVAGGGACRRDRVAQNERELLESSCRQAGVPVLLKPVLLKVQEPAWCGGYFALPYFILLQEVLYLRPCRRCVPYGGSTAGCQRRRPASRLPSRRVSRTPAHIPAAARIFTRRCEGRWKRANEQRAEGFGDAFSG